MTQRERTLTIVMLVVIFALVGGFFGYQFILSPLREQSKMIATLEDDIKTREADREANRATRRGNR